MSILTLADVSYTYWNKSRPVNAINNVTYAFELGKLYAIRGKSGSGKTTLISLMAGLDVPSNGEVCYMGVATSRLERNRYRRENVSVIYQNYNLLPLLTVIENTMYPLRLQNRPAKEAALIASAKLQAVGLDERFHKRYPSMLSGGEQQRVAIARALCSSANVILADEPTGNLDVENGKNILSILNDLSSKQNYCVIIVTHDEDIANKADVIVRMEDGKIVGD